MQTRSKYDIEKLLFRRQFILGPRFVEELTSWQRINVGSTICLTVHPDLSTHQTVHKNKSITLLGYVLDPSNPQAQDPDIIHSLIRELDTCDSLDNFFEHTYIFGGRWILIVDDSKEIKLFNDAAGYRQVFHTSPSSSPQDTWCASQPGLIAKVLHLEMDREALGFISSQKERDKQYWWPGDSSPYKEIKHLLPNHYLDLRTGLPHRYWPNRNLDHLPLEEAVERNSEILQGLMKSAYNRFDLALSLTAGRDTRLLLAASKEIRNRLLYFTLIYWDLSEDSPDVRIPSRLLAKLGLRNHIIKCPPYMEDEFRQIYRRNVTTARDVYGTIAQGLYDHYPQDKVCVKGNAIPIAKCHYRSRLSKLPEAYRSEITGLTLARLTKMEESSFAIGAFESWLLDSRKMYNIDILDLFWWEDREANWQAMSQLEWDIVQEVFVPYNCRAFLTNMLSVDEEYRKQPEYRLHKELIVNLWPEVLSEPINPPRRPSVKERVRRRVPIRLRRWRLNIRDRMRSNR